MAQRYVIFLVLLCLSTRSHGHMHCILSGGATGDYCMDVVCTSTGTLHDVNEVSHAHDEVEIYLCSDQYNIIDEEVLVFENFSSISITGRPSMSFFYCRGRPYGLHFINISKIELADVIFDHCGFTTTYEEFGISSSVYIISSMNISVKNISIANSFGLGMAIVNSSGCIQITNSNFANNHDPTYQNSGGGIFIESSSQVDTVYHVENCTFRNNKASNDTEIDTRLHYGVTDVVDFARGGGMSAYFRAETSSIVMSITECLFENNTAIHGGAMDISFQHSAHNVTVIVDESTFVKNSAAVSGGAVAAGYIHNTEKMAQNKIRFTSCTFSCNDAHNGGGVYVYAAPKYKTKSSDTFKFDRCTWQQNEGMYGSALFISQYTSKKFFKHGFLPALLIKDSLFINNRYKETSVLNHSYSQVKYGRGAIYINSFSVVFQGEVELSKNFNSALYLYSSTLEILNTSNIVFEENSGYQGGAIHLRGPSSIHVNDNISVTFDNNVATHRGGAIFHEALADESHLSNVGCFMKYVGDAIPVPKRNITVHFVDNNHSPHLKGRFIYLFSVIPCQELYFRGGYLTEESLNSIATFTFGGAQSNMFATHPSDILAWTPPNLMIPGKEEHLNIVAVDGSNNSLTLPIYVIGSDPTNNNITIDSAYTIIKNNRIKLQGSPGSSGSITVQLLEQVGMKISFSVTLDECPPGYVYSDITSECVCSANTDALYLGVKRCKLESHRATLVQGYWGGYLGNATEKSFRTSHCPLGYCTNGANSEILLPAKASHDVLNEVICAENRMGVICGECVENTSVYSHTQGTFDCGLDQGCQLGFLWLFLSEVIPITILFLAVIFFDIQLTTGALNGFFLYMQILSTLHITANNFIKFPKFAEVMLQMLDFVAHMCKLNFFNLSSLSFCLFKGTNTLHLLAIDNLIVIYSLFLIVLTILLLNMRCKKFNKLCRHFKNKRSVIHGFSGFLVLCYAKSTLPCLLILKSVKLYGQGHSGGERVVFFQGNMSYFGSEHRKYAIPALFALVFMAWLTPFLLLIYPLCYKVLSLFGLQESKIAKLLCMIIPLEKFKPLFDSFQSEFKDNLRFFAGLYFIYRLLALIIFAFTNTLTEFFFFLELLLIFMLALHGWFQPYKKKWHNRLDLYIFTLLVVINRMTQNSYQQSLNIYKEDQFIAVLTTIQVLLAYTPLVYITVYIFKKAKLMAVVRYLCGKIKKKNGGNDMELSLSFLDQRRQAHNAADRYHKFD